MEHVFGKGCFDQVIGEREGIPKKPDPTGALTAAAAMGAKPSECLYFGDTNTDMQTGKNAKMTTVGVLWGFRGREELAAFHPEYLIEKPEEILRGAGGGGLRQGVCRPAQPEADGRGAHSDAGGTAGRRRTLAGAGRGHWKTAGSFRGRRFRERRRDLTLREIVLKLVTGNGRYLSRQYGRKGVRMDKD